MATVEKVRVVAMVMAAAMVAAAMVEAATMAAARAAAGLRAPVAGWPPVGQQRWAARACGGWRQGGAWRACLRRRLRRVISGGACGGRSPAAAAAASGLWRAEACGPGEPTYRTAAGGAFGGRFRRRRRDSLPP